MVAAGLQLHDTTFAILTAKCLWSVIGSRSGHLHQRLQLAEHSHQRDTSSQGGPHCHWNQRSGNGNSVTFTQVAACWSTCVLLELLPDLYYFLEGLFQISERVFTLESLEGHQVAHDEEVHESGLNLRCVSAPDFSSAWNWRIRDGVLETRTPSCMPGDQWNYHCF